MELRTEQINGGNVQPSNQCYARKGLLTGVNLTLKLIPTLIFSLLSTVLRNPVSRRYRVSVVGRMVLECNI
jgi:hypothetical protein